MLAEDIGNTYKTGIYEHKRELLSIFAKKIIVDAPSKTVVKFELPEDISELVREGSVRLGNIGVAG